MTNIAPAFMSIDDWLQYSGMSKTATYTALKEGNLIARRMGTKNLIDVQHGIEWINSLPRAFAKQLPA